MKKLFIPRIETNNVTDMQDLANVLNELPPQAIDCVNWVKDYPSKPQVEFTAAHGGDKLFLQYEVHENELLAVVDTDNGRVWTDTCVEFFVSFDGGEHYYNLECNCIGRVLLGYRKTGEKGQHAAPDVLQTIQRLPSLGSHVRERIRGNFRWSLTLAIPATAFWMSGLTSFAEVSARANFYKCGDNLSTPHYVSWAEIETDKPDFHQPRFFGSITFE